MGKHASASHPLSQTWLEQERAARATLPNRGSGYSVLLINSPMLPAFLKKKGIYVFK